MPAEWEPAPDRGLGPLMTHGWATQPRWSAAKVRRTWGQYSSPSVSTHLSHTRNINLSWIKYERLYFYKEVYSFVHWSTSLCLIMFRIYLYMYTRVYILCSCMWLFNIWKKSCFILSDRSGFHMIGSLLIAALAFIKCILTLLSVNEMLLPKYMNLLTNFRGP